MEVGEAFFVAQSVQNGLFFSSGPDFDVFHHYGRFRNDFGADFSNSIQSALVEPEIFALQFPRTNHRLFRQIVSQKSKETFLPNEVFHELQSFRI